jgi:hypothetical protein
VLTESVAFFASRERIGHPATLRLMGCIAKQLGSDFPVNPVKLGLGSVIIADTTSPDTQLYDQIAAITAPKNERGEPLVPTLLVHEAGRKSVLDDRLNGVSSFRPEGISYDLDKLFIVESGIRAFLQFTKVVELATKVLEPDAVLDDDQRFDDEAGIQLY